MLFSCDLILFFLLFVDHFKKVPWTVIGPLNRSKALVILQALLLSRHTFSCYHANFSNTGSTQTSRSCRGSIAFPRTWKWSIGLFVSLCLLIYLRKCLTKQERNSVVSNLKWTEGERNTYILFQWFLCSRERSSNRGIEKKRVLYGHQFCPPKTFFSGGWCDLHVRPCAFFRVLWNIADFRVSTQPIVDCSG